eukprot:scaffold367_cov274-Ochromonas_danica.AAC.5
MSSLKRELDKIFGPEEGASITLAHIKQLLKSAWQGDICGNEEEEGLRPLCWRVLLGLLSSSSKSLWVSELEEMVTQYDHVKDQVMPSIDKVKVDPLSALSDGETISEEWALFYQNVELINFINGDLDRLYLNGVEENFFQRKFMRSILLSNLFIWASEHGHLSYRQGMHEICGIVLYVVYAEYEAWQRAKENDEGLESYYLASSFTEEKIEAYTYAIFNRIMMELEPLYDPLPVAGAENMPFIVQYCTKIQEHYLRILDPQLCSHLEEVYIQAQLYGLRWARLLLGREFTVQPPPPALHQPPPSTPASLTHSHHQHPAGSGLLKLWDFMFASCYDLESGTNLDNAYLDDEDIMPNIYSVLATVRAGGFTKEANQNKRAIVRPNNNSGSGNTTSSTSSSVGEGEGKVGGGGGGGMGGISSPVRLQRIDHHPLAPENHNIVQQATSQKVVYVCTPLLGALGDFMLAMLIQIRHLLLRGDQTEVMANLMHYPQQPIGPILETADMIRRGVIIRDLTTQGSVGLEVDFDLPTAGSGNGGTGGSGGRGGGGGSGNAGRGLRRASAAVQSQQAIQSVGKRVTEGLSSIKLGISDLLSSMAAGNPAQNNNSEGGAAGGGGDISYGSLYGSSGGDDIVTMGSTSSPKGNTVPTTPAPPTPGLGSRGVSIDKGVSNQNTVTSSDGGGGGGGNVASHPLAGGHQEIHEVFQEKHEVVRHEENPLIAFQRQQAAKTANQLDLQAIYGKGGGGGGLVVGEGGGTSPTPPPPATTPGGGGGILRRQSSAIITPPPPPSPANTTSGDVVVHNQGNPMRNKDLLKAMPTAVIHLPGSAGSAGTAENLKLISATTPRSVNPLSRSANASSSGGSTTPRSVNRKGSVISASTGSVGGGGGVGGSDGGDHRGNYGVSQSNEASGSFSAPRKDSTSSNNSSSGGGGGGSGSSGGAGAGGMRGFLSKTNWFSSSSSSSLASPSRHTKTSPGSGSGGGGGGGGGSSGSSNGQDRKDRQSIGGVGLNVFHQDNSHPGANGSSSSSFDLSLASTGVGDRLLELAATLSTFAKLYPHPNEEEAEHEDENDLRPSCRNTVYTAGGAGGGGEGNVYRTQNVYEDLCNRLALLSDVLVGQKTIVDYDQRYGNVELPLPPPPATTTSAVSTNEEVSFMSPLKESSGHD